MARTSKQESEPLFQPRDDPAKKVWEHVPPKAERKEFLEFVGKTGKPHEYKYHLHTQPPPSSQPIILERFVVPERLRNKVTRAPCPICCIGYPKYWEGILVYFPEERAMRAIGHECGRHFFATGVYDKAEEDYERQIEIDANIGFLINNLPKVAPTRRLIASLIPRAKVLDQTRATFGRTIPKRLAAELNKHVKDGTLKFYEDQEGKLIGRTGRVRLDKDGEELTHIEKVVVKTLPVRGLSVFSNTHFSVTASLLTADHALSPIETSDDDSAMHLIERLGYEGLAEAAQRLRTAWQFLDSALETMGQMAVFLESGNIKNLDSWGQDHRSPIGLRCRYVGERRLELGEWKKESRTIPIAEQLCLPLPALPRLDVT